MSNTKKMEKMETKNTQNVENQTINNTKIKLNTKCRDIFNVPQIGEIIKITFKNESITNEMFGENQISIWRMCKFIVMNGSNKMIETNELHDLINMCKIEKIK